MSSRSRWIVRLVRLLTLCVAVLVARPAAATPAIDRIVLVAETRSEPATARSTSEDELASRSAASRTTRPHARAVAGAMSTHGVRPFGATRAPLVLVPDKYLRNCSLLR